MRKLLLIGLPAIVVLSIGLVYVGGKLNNSIPFIPLAAENDSLTEGESSDPTLPVPPAVENHSQKCQDFSLNYECVLTFQWQSKSSLEENILTIKEVARFYDNIDEWSLRYGMSGSSGATSCEDAVERAYQTRISLNDPKLLEDFWTGCVFNTDIDFQGYENRGVKLDLWTDNALLRI